MNKISNYMVTATGARRTVTFTIEHEYLDKEEDGDKLRHATKAVTYSYGPREPMPTNPDEDAWQYTLPSGETYTHPNKHGCLHLILSHAIGNEERHSRPAKLDSFIHTHSRL